ncbi:hypothetical protein PT286_00005, partial [Neisseriaceae bacterium ESL0693]|nr:hypothetical protein [Neisseriaceae bacterium ESL0693]
MNAHKYMRFRSRSYTRIHWINRFIGLIMLMFSLLLALPGLVYAAGGQNDQSDQASVKLPNTEYTESHVDLRVAAIGGEIKLNRTWVNGRWYLNPAWADLRFVLDPLNSSVKVIDRAGTLYQRSGQSDLYTNHQVSIKKTDSGWRWTDLQGNWIDYDSQGRILAYGDANNVSVRFVLDKDGRRIGINDTNGEQAYQFSYDSQERLIKATDRSGRSVSYEWSGERLIKVTDVLGHVWQYGYDSNGQLNQKTEPDGGIVRIEYSASAPAPKTAMTSGKAGGTISQNAVVTTGATNRENKLARVGKITDKTGAITLYNSQYDKAKRQYTITVYDALGKKVVTRFDAEGKVQDQTINDKLTERYQRDSAKHLVIYTDARGQVTTTQYNQAEQPLKIVYPNGATEFYEYNSQNKPVKFTNAKGDVATFAYNSNHQLTKMVYAAGKPEQKSISISYDSYGQPISTTLGEGKEAIQIKLHYDRYGNVDTYTDAQGHQYHYSYNVQGQPVSLQNPLQQTWQLHYDAAGRLTKFTDPLQHSTQFGSDELGRLTRITDALGNSTQYHYLFNQQKREIQVTNALNQTASYHYDAAGHLIQSISPSGLISKQHYNAEGDIDSRTDVAGNSISYEYGAKDSAYAGLLIKTSYPTYSETYQYDALGNPITISQQFDQQTLTSRLSYDQAGLTSAITDAAGRSSRFVYNALGQLTQQTNAQNHTTQYQYDPLGNLSQVTNAKGQAYTFKYDPNSNPTLTTRSLGNNVQNRYNEAGQLIEQQQASGQRVQYQYDASGNVIKERYFAPQQTTAAQEVSYRYDATGRLIEVSQSGDTNSHFSYQRDALGRITAESITYGSGSQAISRTLHYSYNADNQLAGITYPDNTSLSYQYQKGQLSQVLLANGEAIRWSDYQWMQPGKISYPHAVQTNQYDGLQRLSQTSVSANSQSILNRHYSYDKAGNISLIKSEQGETRYQYDNLDRLIQVTPSNELISKGHKAEAYSYDAIGNRTGSIGSQWTYNQLGQLSQWGEAGNQTTLSYSANGHLTHESRSGQEREYHYNAADRLTSISQNGTEIASYQYDPFGRRISKTVNGETRYYL